MPVAHKAECRRSLRLSECQPEWRPNSSTGSLTGQQQQRASDSEQNNKSRHSRPLAGSGRALPEKGPLYTSSRRVNFASESNIS